MAKRRRPQKKKKGSTTETSVSGAAAVLLPPPLPESDNEDDHDPIPSAPPLGPASQRVLFWDETSVSNGSTHGTDDGGHLVSNGKSQRNCGRRLNGRSKRSLPNGAGWERLRLSLSPSSYGGSFNNLQSMYQSVVDRSFSIIVQTEEGSVFWSTLLQGFSVLPLFMLVATACSNTAFGILFTAVGDVPHLQGWADWARLGLSTIGTMIALRNLLVSMYELVLDSTAQYPLLNPGLLSRLRSIVAVRPHGLQRLIAVLHLTSSTTLYGLTLLGIQQGNLPKVWLNRCHIFGVNTAIKLATWWLYEFYEERAKKAAAAKGVGRPTPSLGPRHGSGRHLRLLRRVRKVIIYYVATSDVLLLLILVGNYLTRGEGRELLLLEQDAHHDELERRVVAFNSLALVLTNLAAFGQFTWEALTYGAHLLDRATWTASIAHSRQASLIFTGLAYCVSMRRHGYLPSFFTLLVVFNGLSLSKVTLWACIEVQRTLLPLWITLRKHPGWVLLVLLTYAGATRTPSDALLVTLFVTSLFWAWQIQVRLHYVDVWAFGLTGLAVFMALHQAWHHGERHLQPATGDLGHNQDDGIFRVQLSETHLNITSGLGPKSIGLRPFHSPTSSSPSSASYPFCELNLHGLSLLDYAGLCFLAYLKRDSPAFKTFFAAAFDPAEWEVKHAPSPRAQGAVFLDMFNRRLNTSFIAIRGTNPINIFDVFQDMIMFNGYVLLGMESGLGMERHKEVAFCWDMVGMLVPLIQFLPAMWTANLLYLSYLPLKLKFDTMPAYRELSLHYHREIQSYVEHMTGRKVVLTGHSLGGGIGKVVAARLLLPIIAISAPGIALSHKLFDVPRENLDKFEVNLISGEDLVPKVDRLNGLIMKMRCTKSNPLGCHELGYTLSELHDKCGLPFWAERHRK